MSLNPARQLSAIHVGEILTSAALVRRHLPLTGQSPMLPWDYTIRHKPLHAAIGALIRLGSSHCGNPWSSALLLCPLACLDTTYSQDAQGSRDWSTPNPAQMPLGNGCLPVRDVSREIQRNRGIRPFLEILHVIRIVSIDAQDFYLDVREIRSFPNIFQLGRWPCGQAYCTCQSGPEGRGLILDWVREYGRRKNTYTAPNEHIAFSISI